MPPKLSPKVAASKSIERKLKQLPKLAETQPFIYRVHEHLRVVNPKAYEPEIVAIGPYHRKKANLKMMEQHKWRFLRSLLDHKVGVKVDDCLSAVEKLEKDVHNCYAEPTSGIKSAEFIEMMVLDGCFIIGLISSSSRTEDPIFHTLWIKSSLRRDLLLFENQIPFIVLSTLFELLIGNPEDLNPLILLFFKDLYPGPEGGYRTDKKLGEVRHLLELIHSGWSPTGNAAGESHNIYLEPAPTENPGRFSQFATKLKDVFHVKFHTKTETATPTGNAAGESHNIDLEPAPTENPGRFSQFATKLRDVFHKKSENNVNAPVRFSQSATKLKDVYHVKFEKKAENNVSLFDISLKDGKMQLPPLRIDNQTDSLFRNLIVYEQYFHDNRTTFVTNYANLLDTLISSSRDVDILSRCGAINNCLGDSEVVDYIINGLTESVTGVGEYSYYASLYKQTRDHCKNPWNRSVALLKKDYIPSRWAYFPIAGAIILLVLTLLQTVLSGMQTFEH